MFITPLPMFMGVGGFSAPAVTVGRADIGGLGAFYGYIRSGGPTSAAAGGLSGGTLSATLVPGFVTDAVYDSGGAISIIIMGNCEALLSSVTAMTDNGTPLPILGPPGYYPGDNYTELIVDGAWAATGNRTVQLV